MQIRLSNEEWNGCGQPSVGDKWYFKKKGKKIRFNIVEQGWTAYGVFLILNKHHDNEN